MSIKTKILAAAATLTLVGGLGVTGELAANAATPSCGNHCIDIFSNEFGTHHSPNFVLDVLRQGARVGQPIILYRTSNSDPAEDFTVSYQGTVADFYSAKLVSASLDLHYSHLYAFEFQYSPNGVNSGLCMGVGSTAANATPVALEPCGASAKTVWVVYSYNSITGHYVPLITGSDANFSHPYVRPAPATPPPPAPPPPHLNTHTLQQYPNGTVFNNEQGGADYGILK